MYMQSLRKEDFEASNVKIFNESIEAVFDYIDDNNLWESVNDEENEFALLDEVGAVKKAAAVLKHKSKNLDRKVDKTADNLLKAIKQFTIGDERENIITGRTKVSALLKKLILLGGVALIPVIGPLCALLGSITYLIIKHEMTKKEKLKILRELDSEMAIVDAKIEDADREGNKKAKYALMRLKNQMQRDAQRIKYASTI